MQFSCVLMFVCIKSYGLINRAESQTEQTLVILFSVAAHFLTMSLALACFSL